VQFVEDILQHHQVLHRRGLLRASLGCQARRCSLSHHRTRTRTRTRTTTHAPHGSRAPFRIDWWLGGTGVLGHHLAVHAGHPGQVWPPRIQVLSHLPGHRCATAAAPAVFFSSLFNSDQRHFAPQGREAFGKTGVILAWTGIIASTIGGTTTTTYACVVCGGACAVSHIANILCVQHAEAI
jgi:hypothetical protein